MKGFISVVLHQEFDRPQPSGCKAKQYDGDVKYWRAVPSKREVLAISWSFSVPGSADGMENVKSDNSLHFHIEWGSKPALKSHLCYIMAEDNQRIVKIP